MSEASSQAHSNDSSNLKDDGLTWVMPDLRQQLEPAIPKSRSKSDRGFNHDVLARMLCPATKLDRLQNDPGYVTHYYCPPSLSSSLVLNFI